MKLISFLFDVSTIRVKNIRPKALRRRVNIENARELFDFKIICKSRFQKGKKIPLEIRRYLNFEESHESLVLVVAAVASSLVESELVRIRKGGDSKIQFDRSIRIHNFKIIINGFTR